MRLRLMSGLMLMVVACGGSRSGDSEPELSELAAVEPTAVPAAAPPAPDPNTSAPPTTGSAVIEPSPAPSAGAAGSGGIPGWCLTALIAPLPKDGVCGEPHVCGIPDPDCAPAEPAGYDCDISKITCQTFAPVICPDGQVPTVENQCYGKCVPKDECAPLEGGGDGGGVACAAFIEQPDGKCSRADDDPCRSQDPDCKLP
jgi:hypothetical protein